MAAIDLNDLATAIGQLIIRFRLRRRTAADWLTNNEVLYSAEMGYETDTNKLKIGDGTTPWVSLAYWDGGENAGGDTLTGHNAGTGIDITRHQDLTPGTGGNPTDNPNFSKVAVVTHFDALSGAVAIDSGPMGATIAPIGNTVISATQSKFGGHSSYADEVPQTGWTVTDNVNFDWSAGGDFTVQGWFYASGALGASGILTLWAKQNGITGLGGIGIRLSDDGLGSIVSYIHCTDGTVLESVWTASFRTGHSPGPGAWVHVALVRHGTNIALYINGVQPTLTSGGTIGTKAVVHGGDNFYIGASAQSGVSTDSWRGYCDDFMVSAHAEYTANFTPPVVAQPGYSTPTAALGVPYPIITNTGVRSIVAGTGVTVNNADPYNPIVSSSGSSGGGGNVTADTHPSSPTAWDDEFEHGSTVDTTGARFTGANAWTLGINTAAAGIYPSVAQGSLCANYQTSVGFSLMYQALPTGNCTFVIKTRKRNTSNNGGFNIGILNHTNGNCVHGEIFNASQVVQRATFNLSTFAYSNTSNVYNTDPIVVADSAYYIRIRIVSGTMYFGWSASGVDGDWDELYSEAITAWVGTATHVTIMNAGATATCDWFRRTA